MDSTVRRHQETGQKIIKSRAGQPKAKTRVEDYFFIRQLS